MRFSFLTAFALIGVLAAGVNGLTCWECHGARSNDECLQTGKMKNCVELNAICEDQIRHSQNKDDELIIEKRCKQKHACTNNVNQNIRKAYPIQCNLKSPTSTCRCCCETDLCNMNLLTCWNGIKQYDAPFDQGPRSCGAQPKVPQNANMQCAGNMEPKTYCDFTCHSGFYMKGRRRTTCLANLKWNSPPPTCAPITCFPYIGAPGNGSVRCTNGNKHRSHCRFTCAPDYALIGASSSTCISVGTASRKGRWSNPTPFCKPLFCPPRQPPIGGRVSCTRGRGFGSTCTYTCDADRVVYPATDNSAICTDNETWSKPVPCCSLVCPPGAVMDFIVVLDSSSSVGEENWGKMKAFVRSFLDDFTVSDTTAHYAIVRYNRDVDQSTQILLNDYPNDINALLEAYDRIPYDGSGTRTGNALAHTADVLLTTGNRPEARDIVLLITDGASQDDVSFPARRIRSTGALLYVLPVLPPRGKLDFKQIEQIAGEGNEDNILRAALEGGFDALNEDFAAEMSELLCTNPCGNPFESA